MRAPGSSPDRVANALAAFQAPPPEPSPPEVPEGGEEGAPAADASGEPPPPAKPTKTARDGTVVELDLERFTRIVPKVDAPATFDADSWQERIARCAQFYLPAATPAAAVSL